MMELFEINNLKSRLITGETIELISENDIVCLFHRKSLDGSLCFFIQLNAKIISMNKRFRTFRDKVWDLVNQRDLAFANV